MRTIISILVGLLSFIGVFWLTGSLINWLISGFDSNETKQIAKVILWIFGFTWTLVIAFITAWFTGSITNILVTRKRNKKYVIKR